MTSRLPDDPQPTHALIKCTIEGLEVEADWPALKAWLAGQARFNQLCSQVVTTRRGGVAIQLRMPMPKTAIFVWRGYVVEATGFMGEIHIKARKAKESDVME